VTRCFCSWSMAAIGWLSVDALEAPAVAESCAGGEFSRPESTGP
jgi:hypothetical protein